MERRDLTERYSTATEEASIPAKCSEMLLGKQDLYRASAAPGIALKCQNVESAEALAMLLPS